MESASVAVEHAPHEHHGPPEAHASSRIDRQTLGILLFIVSEVMLFGAFFASYFFLRVVANDGPWPPDGLDPPGRRRRHEHRDPDLVELHRPLGARVDPPRQPQRHDARPRRHLAPRRDLPLHPDQRVRPPRLQRPRPTPSARSSTASRASTAPTSPSASSYSRSPTSAPGAATSARSRRSTSASRCRASTGTSSTSCGSSSSRRSTSSRGYRGNKPFSFCEGRQWGNGRDNDPTAPSEPAARGGRGAGCSPARSSSTRGIWCRSSTRCALGARRGQLGEPRRSGVRVLAPVVL